MLEVLGVSLAAGLAGAAWRRWFGSETNNGHGWRAIKTAAGFVLFFAVAFYTVGNWWQALALAAVFSTGMSFGHTFDPWESLIWRYGAVSAAVAAAMIAMGFWTDSVSFEALAYAPWGMLTPVGYIVGRVIADQKEGFCWSCVGEGWMGFILLAPLPCLRLLAS